MDPFFLFLYPKLQNQRNKLTHISSVFIHENIKHINRIEIYSPINKTKNSSKEVEVKHPVFFLESVRLRSGQVSVSVTQSPAGGQSGQILWRGHCVLIGRDNFLRCKPALPSLTLCMRFGALVSILTSCVFMLAYIILPSYSSLTQCYDFTCYCSLSCVARF